MGLYGARPPDHGKPRRYRIDLKCKGKRRCVTEVEARAIGHVTIEESSGKTLHLWVYLCQHCDGWHLTSKNQGARWRIEAIAKNPEADHAPAT